MKEMTTRERVARMYEHQESDRIPLYEPPWPATVERWRREGMPADVSHVQFFGLDRMHTITVDNSPRYETRVVEETDDYIIATTGWGVTARNWKHRASTPEFLDTRVKTPDDWREAKKRMVPSEDRIPWERLKRDYPRWREEGAWISGGGWFGFDVTHAWFLGTERLLVAMATDSEWCVDMFRTFQDGSLALLDRVWDAGYRFDALSWPDDMGYKNKQFFSLRMYRELLKPIHQQAVEWAHAKGIKAYLHSCGNITPFVPELVEIGLDGLNPIEVKAGMDPLALKREYGDVLLLHGGINALIWNDVGRMEAHVREVVPLLKAGGGYIFGTDHSTPSSVSLEDFRRIVEVVKEVGRY